MPRSPSSDVLVPLAAQRRANGLLMLGAAIAGSAVMIVLADRLGVALLAGLAILFGIVLGAGFFAPQVERRRLVRTIRRSQPLPDEGAVRLEHTTLRVSQVLGTLVFVAASVVIMAVWGLSIGTTWLALLACWGADELVTARWLSRWERRRGVLVLTQGDPSRRRPRTYTTQLPAGWSA